MASSARIQANRLNAQKSTGPRTAQGKAAEPSHSQVNPAADRKVNKVNRVNEVNKVPTPRSKNALAVDREPAIPAQLASFDQSASEAAPSDSSDFPLLEEKTTPYGVTTNEDRAMRALAETLHDSSRETNPISGEFQV